MAEERKALVRRFFTRKETDVYNTVDWTTRDAVITGPKGETVFKQENVEFPSTWSQNAVNVVASKYFRGPLAPTDGAIRENSLKQSIDRVADTITGWGNDGYFRTDTEPETFRAELKYILLHQYACFNSPVWFNVGVEATPQCSACFILSIDDSIDGILEWYRTEGKIFKGGSGSGVNLGKLRSSKESVTGGGVASGPVSFMRGADAIAGTIKSGGKTRRAAKMVVLDVEHPDIEEFIWCKVKEERKAKALGEAGFSLLLDSDTWNSVQYQNANNSIRVNDYFMEAATTGQQYSTKFVRTKEAAEEKNASQVLQDIAQAAWECADPGMQYDETIQKWHTCPQTGRINASNPCSEYMHVDDSACNLSSINLLKFVKENGKFDFDAFKHVIEIMILAQEFIVGKSAYPTKKIEHNTRAHRQLGLGYTNLGALLMSKGIPYASQHGRSVAATLASVMTGYAYYTSARIAERKGPFDAYKLNKDSMLEVIKQHRRATYALEGSFTEGSLDVAREVWDMALAEGEEHGYRNAQATVLAPTGTISFMMDCDTTGIEPDIALIKYKTLAGGGAFKIVNKQVGAALSALGYPPEEQLEISAWLQDEGTIEGAPHLRDEHLPVFDCAFKAERGTRSIHWLDHVKMMEAVQPFISGAISKTVNLPEDATVDDVRKAYIEGWKRGLKALAVYRDGSKNIQVLNTSKDGKKTTSPAPAQIRKKMPKTRASVSHSFSVGGHKGYIHVGLYDDGKPGELFITMSKEGSTLSGMMDAFAIMVSDALQYGVPLSSLVKKFEYMQFEPSGMTGDPDIPMAKSIVDYIFRWLGQKFLQNGDKNDIATVEIVKESLTNEAEDDKIVNDSIPCFECGSLMVRVGGCEQCLNCGATGGCS